MAHGTLALPGWSATVRMPLADRAVSAKAAPPLIQRKAARRERAIIPVAIGNGNRAMQASGGERQPVVLVAEPQALPGMWLEDVFTAAGRMVSGPYGTCEVAAAGLEENPPDFAVISVDLDRGPGFPLACALRRRGIPFVLIAGNTRVPGAFADAPVFDRLSVPGTWSRPWPPPVPSRIARGPA